MEDKKVLPIEVGDYVEPIHRKFKELPIEFSYENLYGYVIEKSNGFITISSIGSNYISTFSEAYFVKGTVPEIFKEIPKTRVRK